MYLNKTIKLSGGTVTFSGEFSDEEIDFLIEYALTELLEKGIIPIDAAKGELMPPLSEELH